jgi:hypothetical protein
MLSTLPIGKLLVYPDTGLQTLTKLRGVYKSHYTAPDVPVDKVTHLVYAFADLDVDGQM